MGDISTGPRGVPKATGDIQTSCVGTKNSDRRCPLKETEERVESSDPLYRRQTGLRKVGFTPTHGHPNKRDASRPFGETLTRLSLYKFYTRK